MNDYKLVRLISRKNKENKSYYLAVVLFSNDYDSDLIRILVKDNQVDKLNSLLKSNQVDMNNYIKIEYNSYQKCYQPKINI